MQKMTQKGASSDQTSGQVPPLQRRMYQKGKGRKVRKSACIAVSGKMTCLDRELPEITTRASSWGGPHPIKQRRIRRGKKEKDQVLT